MSNFNRLNKLLAVVVSLILVTSTSVRSNASTDQFSTMVREPFLSDFEKLYQWHTFWKPVNTLPPEGDSKVAVDSMGNIFIVTSSDSAWSGPTDPDCKSPHPYRGDVDILVIKLSHEGNYQCHTYLGGTSTDVGWDIAVDPDGNVYVGGYGMDWNYYNGEVEILPRQPHDAGGPTFTVIKLDNDLGYQWHTFEGKFVNTFGGIALDSENNVYVSGASRETNYGTDKLTIAKIKNSGEPVETDGTEIWFRSYGDYARAYDIAVNDGGVVAVGYSYTIWPIGINAPLQGIEFQSIPIVKLDLDGNYQWHTFYGQHNEEARAVKFSSQGEIIIAGSSKGFAGSFGESPIHRGTGYSMSFVLNLSSDGDYAWHTFYGDGQGTGSKDIDIDQLGNIYLVGNSTEALLGEYSTRPVNPFSTYNNIFILSLGPNGHYRWHTFYGSGICEESICDYAYGVSSHGDEIFITGESAAVWPGDNGELPLDNFGFDYGLFVLALQPSFIVPITGRVVRENGTPEQGVKVTAVQLAPPKKEVASSITDDQGRYHLVVQGLFDFIKPEKNGLTFFPGQENIEVCLDCISGFFEIPGPFLDVPLDYSNYLNLRTALLANSLGTSPGGSPGRVNSLFDHDLPTWGLNNNKVITWEGSYYGDLPSDSCSTGRSCYDWHDAVDFQHDNSKANESVYSAAPGVVREVCPPSCGRGYSFGKYVLVDHENGYATLYAHLAEVNENFIPGVTRISDLRAEEQKIGIMGGTPDWEVHLHFALYFDIDNDLSWEQGEQVDPYGWISFEPDHKLDPWELVVVGNVIKTTGHPASRWMWKDPPQIPNTIGVSGGTINSVSGITQVTVPPGAVSSNYYFELWDTSPILDPLPFYRSTGRASWLRIPSLVTSKNGISYDKPQVTVSSFRQPLSIEVSYEDGDLIHLDENKLTLVQYDETTKEWIKLNSNIDSNTNRVFAQTYEAGRFDLQAQLRCSTDINEPDDGYSSSKHIDLPNNTNINFFDSPSDEDWFRFNATSGVRYLIEILSTTPNVKPILELYDEDGVTLLETAVSLGGKNILNWSAKTQGIYFVRVRQAPGSAYGCDAGIQANLAAEVSIWLPMVSR